MGGLAYIPDVKTTKHQLDSRHWSQFQPHNQFSLYDLAGAIALEHPANGIIVDGMQILVNSTRFERKLIQLTPDQRQEFLGSLSSFWFPQMEASAEAANWPMNESSCDKYGGCSFRGVCSRTPGARRGWLESNFTVRSWDPLQRRGDI